jgi:hypothetical protein
MTKKITMAFMTAALMVASAAEKHNLTLFQPSFVNGTELAPGDYRMELDGDKVVISKGKNKVQEIRLGGTNRKLVFAGSQTGI